MSNLIDFSATPGVSNVVVLAPQTALVIAGLQTACVVVLPALTTQGSAFTESSAVTGVIPSSKSLHSPHPRERWLCSAVVEAAKFPCHHVCSNPWGPLAPCHKRSTEIPTTCDVVRKKGLCCSCWGCRCITDLWLSLLLVENAVIANPGLYSST